MLSHKVAKMNDIHTSDPDVSERSENTGGPQHQHAQLHNATTTTTTISGPLSWDDARSKLKAVMEKYMETSLPVVQSTATDNQIAIKWRECVFQRNLDFLVGVAVSLALLGLSVASLVSRNNGYINENAVLNAGASLRVYRAQVAASTLLLFGSFFCVFLVKRREYTFCHDSDVSKRKTIAKFLKSTEKCCRNDAVTSSERASTSRDAQNGPTTPKVPQLHHSGTSRTGIYPAYRLPVSGQQEAFWYSIPTLLLVEGDYIALQVGDVAPARCKLLASTDSLSSTSRIIEGGERITTSSFGDLWGLSPSIQFPPGKTTVPSQSRQLLQLCNHMSVFRVEATPLESFLRLPNATQRLPQVHRQMRAIRQVMFLFAIIVLVVTFIIIFIRPGMVSSDLSLVIHTPPLAALASLPVTAPACMFFLEILGLSRILVWVHHFAFISQEKTDSNSERWLFLRYMLAATSSRLCMQGNPRGSGCFVELGNAFRRLFVGVGNNSDNESNSAKLLCIPPASTFLLEKLGVATAFTLIDDELVCEPYSIPQQLLIPSSNGLKLLDLCPTYDTDSEDEHSDDEKQASRKRGRSYGSSPDSDSDSDDDRLNPTAAKRKLKSIRKRRRRRKIRENNDQLDNIKDAQDVTTSDDTDVQFEDPLWWHFLPSLKCIGLASLLIDDDNKDNPKNGAPLAIPIGGSVHDENAASPPPGLQTAERALVHRVCCDRERPQLESLARCIGFNTSPNGIGKRGDLSYFEEKLRVKVVSTTLLDERLALDAHALGLEESRSWGLLMPDSSSVIVQDSRSNAYQLLTVGDPRVVANLCHEAWQGENSTILPLNAVDRSNVIQTSTNWLLSDLDVAAFAYSPVRSTLETRLSSTMSANDASNTLYMVENASKTPGKDRITEDWALIHNQIFLGVLGSSIIPRKEIEKLLETFDEAGVRFVYFSPRNMRRTKELASQIGIDVAWNCAISLRAMEEGEEDPYRMVSEYADWSVNAKLPRGIVNVRTHLKEVDNVPLLVSLFTDATKQSTQEMIETFQDYHDTVLTMGLSHLARNAPIFSTADISIGADVLAEELAAMPSSADSLLPHEVEFVASIASHSCAFNLRGAASTSLMPSIIERGRTAFEAASYATLFILYGTIAFSLYACFSMCTIATVVPWIPTLGSVLYLQIVLPLVSLGLAMSNSDDQSMHRVPPKNDQTLTFSSRNEGKRLYTNTLLKAMLPAILTQVLYLIALGQLMIHFEPNLLQDDCGMSAQDIADNRWTLVIRCKELKSYSGIARTSSGALILAEMVLCVIISSASFIHTTLPIFRVPLWNRNRAWMVVSLLGIALVAIYLLVSDARGSFASLSWYFFFLAAIIPFICLLGNELIKQTERKHIDRADKLRRLQFETRLGMWSPKA